MRPTLVCLRRMICRWKRPHFWAAIESASAALALSHPIKLVVCLFIRSLKPKKISHIGGMKFLNMTLPVKPYLVSEQKL